MRDPERITEICALLEQVWARHPDQRLGQLLVNAARPAQPCPQIYSVEDGRVRRGLRQLAETASSRELPPRPPLAWDAIHERPSTVLKRGASLGSFETDTSVGEVLWLAFGGQYRSGSEGLPDASFMMGEVARGLAIHTPDVVLLDLSELDYRWGDGVLRVMRVIERFDPDIPVGAVVLGGPRSLSGLTSLLTHVTDDLAEAQRRASALALQRVIAIG